MKLSDMFLKSIDRPINGVIKVMQTDDEKSCLARLVRWELLLFAYLTATATTEQGGSFTCSLPLSTCAVHGWIVTSSG